MAKQRLHVIYQNEEGEILIAELTEEGYKQYDKDECVADEGIWEDWKAAESTKRLIKLLGLES